MGAFPYYAMTRQAHSLILLTDGSTAVHSLLLPYYTCVILYGGMFDSNLAELYFRLSVLSWNLYIKCCKISFRFKTCPSIVSASSMLG
jgi:hypothetical protein